MPKPPEHFDGWRLDIDSVWESYNRIYFSYRRSELENENYLRWLYRSHFVVFSYSFIDALVSKLLIEQFKVPLAQLKNGSLRDKVKNLDARSDRAGVLNAYDLFWADIEWIRNELIHTKRRDHLLSVELDGLNAAARMSTLNIFAVKAYEAARLEFQYWLTGWNYVNSMRSDGASQGIVLINNQEFKARLTTMLGYHDREYAGRPLETINDYLVGEGRFEAVLSFLSNLSYETQPLPKEIGLSLMPLLTKVWWDKDKMRELRTYRQSFYQRIVSSRTDGVE